MDEMDHIKERWKLLQTLRNTADSLLMNKVSNVWNIHGSLNLVHTVMEKILKHGSLTLDSKVSYNCISHFKKFNYWTVAIIGITFFLYKGEISCWVFIEGLKWLQPSLAFSPQLSQSSFNESHNDVPTRVKENKDLEWLYQR